MSIRVGRMVLAIGLIAMGMVWSQISIGADRAVRARRAPVQTAPAEKVELFAAIAQQQIDVKFIPKNSTQANVLIENKTNKPLSIQLPAAFAAVPVLGQAAAPAGGAGTTNSQPQPMGGGFGGMGGMGMGGGMGGGGFFNVAPERVAQLQVPGVCLDHGKAEPRPAIRYEIKPLETVTTKEGVRETLAMLAEGQVNQRVAQIVAWHLVNGMSFEELAAKRLQFANGTSQSYFSPAEIKAGMMTAAVAVRAAQEGRKASPSPGESARSE